MQRKSDDGRRSLPPIWLLWLGGLILLANPYGAWLLSALFSVGPIVPVAIIIGIWGLVVFARRAPTPEHGERVLHLTIFVLLILAALIGGLVDDLSSSSDQDGILFVPPTANQ